MDIPVVKTREELRALIDSFSQKQLDSIRSEFLDGFADGYQIDRSGANQAYIEFLGGCVLDWYDEVYSMLEGYTAGLKPASVIANVWTRKTKTGQAKVQSSISTGEFRSSVRKSAYLQAGMRSFH